MLLFLLILAGFVFGWPLACGAGAVGVAERFLPLGDPCERRSGWGCWATALAWGGASIIVWLIGLAAASHWWPLFRPAFDRLPEGAAWWAGAGQLHATATLLGALLLPPPGTGPLRRAMVAALAAAVWVVAGVGPVYAVLAFLVAAMSC